MLQAIHTPSLSNAKIKLFIKREDLLKVVPNNPHISGNKWRKLKYNLLKAKQEKKSTLLSFGGAYSNHLHALAAAGKAFDFSTIGIIRGEPIFPLNPTLQFAHNQGMRLEYVSRQEYRQKNEPTFIDSLHQKHENFHLIPEGGTNQLALKGCAEIVENIDISFDYICCPVGTGGTLAGIITSLKAPQKAIGFAALKGNFLSREIQQLLGQKEGESHPNWHIQNDHHFGGYARHTPQLLDFINKFKQEHNIQLEPLYTGKMFYGIFDLIQQQYFPEGTTIIAIHTGGLQGLAGFQERFGKLLI